MFENKKTRAEQIYYTRYIISWLKEVIRSEKGIYIDPFYEGFEDWLRERHGLSKDEIIDIVDIANCGKMELEIDAADYLMREKSQKIQG